MVSNRLSCNCLISSGSEFQFLKSMTSSDKLRDCSQHRLATEWSWQGRSDGQMSEAETSEQWDYHKCSGSVVVTAYDSESGCPGSNPEWGLIYYKSPITAQGSPEPSSLRGSTLGTRAAEHKGCNWACKLTYGCSLKSCVRPHLLAYMPQ